MTPQIFYRYEYQYDSLQLKEYDLIRETPKGYWISACTSWIDKSEKWIPKSSKKRFAYPTVKEALNNYIIRSNRRISILIGQTERTVKGMKKAKKLIKLL